MKETGVFLNAHARKEQIETAEKIARIIPVRPICNYSGPTEEFVKNLPPKALIVGGDGFVGACVREYYKRNEPADIIAILPGGTNNALYRTLVESARVISPEEFFDLDNLPEKFSFRPGVIGKTPFISAAGLGRFEEKLANSVAKLRHLLTNRYSNSLAGVFALSSTPQLRERALRPFIDAFFISPYGGPYHLSKKQELHSESLGHAYVGGESQAVMTLRFITALCYWHLGLIPPKSIFNIELSSSFLVEKKEPFINLDGDLIPVRGLGPVEVMRHKTPIPIAALKL